MGSIRRLVAVAIVLAAGAVAGCGKGSSTGGADAGAPVLKVASQRGGTRALVEASHVLDGAPYRIEWSEFPSAQALLEALAAGAVDAGAIGDAPFMFAYSSGAPIKVVQAARSSGGGVSTAIVVPENSPIRTLADLKGKRIATGRGSIGHYLLLLVLEKAGLAPKDVTIIFLSPGDAKGALSAGSIDAWSTWGSYVGLATLHDHDRVVVDGRGLLHGIGFEAASQGAIDNKRVQLADFLHRLSKAEQWGQTHKPAYAAALAADTGLPADVALYTVTRASAVATPIDQSVVAEEHDTLAHFQRAGAIAATPDITGAFDPSFNSALNR